MAERMGKERGGKEEDKGGEKIMEKWERRERRGEIEEYRTGRGEERKAKSERRRKERRGAEKRRGGERQGEERKRGGEKKGKEGRGKEARQGGER